MLPKPPYATERETSRLAAGPRANRIVLEHQTGRLQLLLLRAGTSRAPSFGQHARKEALTSSVGFKVSLLTSSPTMVFHIGLAWDKGAC